MQVPECASSYLNSWAGLLHSIASVYMYLYIKTESWKDAWCMPFLNAEKIKDSEEHWKKLIPAWPRSLRIKLKPLPLTTALVRCCHLLVVTHTAAQEARARVLTCKGTSFNAQVCSRNFCGHCWNAFIETWRPDKILLLRSGGPQCQQTAPTAKAALLSRWRKLRRKWPDTAMKHRGSLHRGSWYLRWRRKSVFKARPSARCIYCANSISVSETILPRWHWGWIICPNACHFMKGFGQSFYTLSLAPGTCYLNMSDEETLLSFYLPSQKPTSLM